MRKFERADVSCLTVTIIWGANMPLVKDALTELSPMSFNAVRLILAASLLWILTLLIEHRVLLDRKDVKRIFMLGFVGNALYQILFIHGLYLTKAGNVALLLSMGTIFTALLSRALGHERFGPIVWGGIFLSLSGVTIILLESAELGFSGGTFLGDLLILGSSACWSVYTVYSKPMMKSYSPLSLTALTFSIGSLGFLLISVPYLPSQNWEQVSTESYLQLGYSFIFSLAVGYVLWFHGVDRLGSTKTAIYGNLVPFFGILFARIFLREEITVMQIAAGILILTGIYLTRRGQPLTA